MSRGIVTEWFERSRLALKVLDIQLSSGLVKVKVVRKRSGVPPQVHRGQYKLAF